MADRICAVCSALLTKKPGKGRWPLYCSSECEKAARTLRRDSKPSAEKRDPLDRDRPPCAFCGSPVRLGTRGPVGRYCSRACAAALRTALQSDRRRDTRDLLCSRCGARFVGNRSDQKFCSPKCRSGIGREIRCVVCLSTFEYLGHGHPRYCSTGCKRTARVARYRQKNHRRRVQICWRCGLCAKAVNPGLRWPHPLSASLDHIVPLSLGGDHTVTNVQLAHLRCNVSKGISAMNEQLRLIG